MDTVQISFTDSSVGNYASDYELFLTKVINFQGSSQYIGGSPYGGNYGTTQIDALGDTFGQITSSSQCNQWLSPTLSSITGFTRVCVFNACGSNGVYCSGKRRFTGLIVIPRFTTTTLLDSSTTNPLYLPSPTTVVSLPTNRPTASPTVSKVPTPSPMQIPSKQPTNSSISKVTSSPTEKPSATPTSKATGTPTSEVTASPTSIATTPTNIPTALPSSIVIVSPTSGETSVPTASPSSLQTDAPSAYPTSVPSRTTISPSSLPTDGFPPNYIVYENFDTDDSTDDAYDYKYNSQSSQNLGPSPCVANTDSCITSNIYRRTIAVEDGISVPYVILNCDFYNPQNYKVAAYIDDVEQTDALQYDWRVDATRIEVTAPATKENYLFFCVIGNEPFGSVNNELIVFKVKFSYLKKRFHLETYSGYSYYWGLLQST